MIDLDRLPPRLKRSEASEYLLQRHGVSRTCGTLAKLACHGGGPAFRKVGARTVLYDVAELDRWVKEMLGDPVCSTSAAA
ncbi:helix-turn-helix transcriptional regulator [Brucella grignonensis]|uniref:Putative phage-like protein n=1 Tax=Brucella grignonensis TaxID=94627 RepID=A0A256F355_9HYPH|nr:hypothetical protein [Brucella grignonensis]NKB83743.1 hypothetical protein [Brucella grignonensis]OYR09213.1 putative phage-like protein [Brucella grignonensis]